MATSTIHSSNKEWILLAEVTQSANTTLDETVEMISIGTPHELLFTCQRVSNGRVFASGICAGGQFQGGAIYAYGSFSLDGSNPRNAVCIYGQNNTVEFAAESTTEAIKYRLFAR